MYQNSLSQPAFEVQADATHLYNTDGSVNFEAVEDYVQKSADARTVIETGALAIDVAILSPPQEPESKSQTDKPTLEDVLGKPGSREYAFNAYLLRLLMPEIIKAQASGFTVNPEFEQNPNVTLDLRTEIERTLGVAGRLNTDETLLEASPLDVHQLRCIVAIPVAGLQESANIYQTLLNRTQQNELQLAPHEFEVVLHTNYVTNETTDSLEAREQLGTTLSEVERFKKDHPRIVVRNFTTQYETDQLSIGTIRAELFDTIGADLYRRGRFNDILVVSRDADTVSESPNALGALVTTWEQTGVDMVCGKIAWELISSFPDSDNSIANNILEYQMYIDDIVNTVVERPKTWDANFGISLATYFGAAGFTRGIMIGETSNLAHRVRALRQGADRQCEKYVAQAVVVSHSRRLIESMAQGHMPYDAWQDGVTGFGHDDSLRTDVMRCNEAELKALSLWHVWLAQMEEKFLAEVPEHIQSRVLNLGKQALNLMPRLPL